MDSSIIRHKEHKLLDLVRRREISESTARVLPHQLHVTENFISRLGLEKELEGHKGCVNCLEWSESGEILASASDDIHLILWDPFRYEKKLVYHTGHTQNIFSVKFLPKSNNSLVVTGAGDNCVRIHDLSVSETILACTCHTGRVKRIATIENVPFLFWSASEDGLILQYDMRLKHDCKENNRDAVLVDLVSHAGKKAEAKCVSVNRMRPELIAVGSNDPFVRMYDRRMIKLGQVPSRSTTGNDWARVSPNTAGKGDPDDNIPLGCAQYFIAGHLYKTKFKDPTKFYTTTYLTFSADGTELLVNMGGEQLYLFDINGRRNHRIFQKPVNQESMSDDDEDNVDGNDSKMDDDEIIRQSAYALDSGSVEVTEPHNITVLPPDVEEMKQEANLKFQQQHFTHAITLYNKAISLCPHAAVLYANRAAALMKRRWDGDIYSASRDCQMTLLLDPEHVKAHFRLARCLHDLHRPVEAQRVMDDFRSKFANYNSNSSVDALKMDIDNAIDTNTSGTNPYAVQISSHEEEWRRKSIDYKLRYCGHCNTTTDIKEANYFGNDHYIVAGSDDGSFFIWDRYTTNIVRVLRGDDHIVNCLQPHPSTCLLATSGIDRVIRLWSPRPEDGSVNERDIQNLYEAASANQVRMNSDPFELMMMSMGYRVPEQSDDDDEGQNDHSTRVLHPANCRTS